MIGAECGLKVGFGCLGKVGLNPWRIGVIARACLAFFHIERPDDSKRSLSVPHDSPGEPHSARSWTGETWVERDLVSLGGITIGEGAAWLLQHVRQVPEEQVVGLVKSDGRENSTCEYCNKCERCNSTHEFGDILAAIHKSL